MVNVLRVDCGLRDGDYRAAFVGPSNFALRLMRVRDGLVYFRGPNRLFFPGKWVLSPVQNFGGLLQSYQVRQLYDHGGVSDDQVFIFPFDLDTLQEYAGLLPADKLVELESLRVERDVAVSRSADYLTELTDLNSASRLRKRMASDIKQMRSMLGGGGSSSSDDDKGVKKK